MSEVRHRRHAAVVARASTTFLNLDETPTRRHRFHPSLPHKWLVVLGFLSFYATTLALVTYGHTWLPQAKGLDASMTEFSEARARAILEQIMSFGYRPVGSTANEEITPQYLLEQVRGVPSW